MSGKMEYYNNFKYVLLSIGLFLLLPITALAAPGEAEARSFVATLNRVILFPTIGLLSAVAFLMFIWGCAEYFMGAANDQARQQGVKHITYGIIGLVIMMSAFTILTIAGATFGLTVPQ